MAALVMTNILVVGECNQNYEALENALNNPSHKFIKVPTCEAALEFISSTELAMIFLDINQASIEAFETARIIRFSYPNNTTPIIFLCDTPLDPSVTRIGYETGAVDYIFRPYDQYALTGKISFYINLYQKMKKAGLEESITKRDEFLSIASHELRTPLTGLMLQADIRNRQLAKENFSYFTPEKLSAMFASDLRQLEKLNRLVNDMFDVARIHTGRIHFVKKRCNLCELVTEIVDRIKDQYEGNSSQINITSCKEVWIDADPLRIEQVITNIIMNAIKYGRGNPIEVQVTQEFNKYALLKVQDQGIGINPADHVRIFNRFERAVSANEVSGLGLGLSISLEIIKAHEGTIKVVSELNEGSTFIIELPSI